MAKTLTDPGGGKPRGEKASGTSTSATTSKDEKGRQSAPSATPELVPPNTPRSASLGPMNFLKRKLLNKSDGSLDYDSDVTGKRSWRKAASLGSLEKTRSRSRDSSPGRLRGYLDLYKRDSKERRPKKKEGKGSGKKKGSRRWNGSEDYSDADESESSHDVRGSTSSNSARVKSFGASEHSGDEKPVRQPLRTQSLPEREYDSDAGAVEMKKKNRREYDSDTGEKRRPRKGSGMSTPPDSELSSSERRRAVDSPGIKLKKHLDSTAAKLKKGGKKSSKGKRTSLRSERSLTSIDSKSVRSDPSNTVPKKKSQRGLADQQDSTSPNDLMDAPVPARRKLSTFKEEKERMERELLFTKLEVVRLQENLAEAEEKAQEISGLQKEERLNFEKVSNELNRLKQGASSVGDEVLRAEVEELKKQVAEKDQKINALNDSVEEQACKVEHLEAELKSAEEDMLNMEADMKFLENELEGLNWKKEEQDFSNRSIESTDDMNENYAKSDIEHNLATRQAELEAWEKRLKSREQKLGQQDPEESTALVVKEEADDHSVELKRLEQTIPGLENMTNLAIEVMQKEMAEMRSWVVKSARELDADRALLEDDGVKLRELNDENEKLRKWLEEEQAEYSGKLREQEKVSESLRIELENVQATLREERTTRKEDAMYWDDMEREINQQLKEVSDEKKALSERLERALRRAASAESKLATARSDLREHLGTISKLQDEINNAGKAPQWDKSKLERELERMQYKNDLLREKLFKFEHSQANGAVGQSPSQPSDQVQRELTRLESKNDALREKLEKYESQADDNLENEERNKELRNEVARLKMEVEGTNALNETLVKNERKLEREIVDVQCKLEESSRRLQDSLDRIIEERDKLASEVSDLRKNRDEEIQQLKTAMTSLEERNDKLNEQLREREDIRTGKSTKALEAEISRLQDRLKETWIQFEKRHPAEYGALLQELKIRKGEVDTVRKSMYEVQERNKRLELEVFELSQKIEFDFSENGDNSDNEFVDSRAQSELDAVKAELEEWKKLANSWQAKAEISVKESLEWKLRSEEWEQEAAQWETVATEAQASTALGADPNFLVSAAALDEASRSQSPRGANIGNDDDERIRGLTRQNAALDEMINEIQTELTALSGEDDDAARA